MTAPVFGQQFSRPNDEPVPTLVDDFSKILLIETSADADATVFPIGEPVRFSSSDAAMVAKLGTGPLRDAVRGIHAQLEGLNAGADITTVRVAEGANVATTAANIVEVLENVDSIPSKTNSTPRLVWCGRTAWRPNLDTVNPIVAALPAALERLLAVAAVDVDDTSAANAIDARETMSSQRMIPIGVAVRVYEGANLVTRPMGPRVLGLFNRVDNEHGGMPFDPIANQPVIGIAGLSRAIPFSLRNGSVEGQQLLAANVSIVAAGETGRDGAIADGGFHFIGTDNAMNGGDLWEQFHQVRGADYVEVGLEKITRRYLGPKITANLAEAWLNAQRYFLRDLSSDDHILGWDLQFKANRNSPEQIRLGHLLVNIGVEAAPVFKLASHEIRRYRPAVDRLVSEIVARLETA